MKKEKLLKRLKALESKKAELVKRSQESGNVKELQAIHEHLEDLKDEITEVQSEIDELGKSSDDSTSEGDDSNQQDTGGDTDTKSRGFSPMAAYQIKQKTRSKKVNALDTIEYRTAFKTYVQTGKWEYEKREDETLVTSDIGKIIPNTIMNEFIKNLKTYGQLYNRVRKLNIKGGVEFPIEDLVPTVSWITETAVSATQKTPTLKTSVSFGYHVAEARIAQSLLSQVVSLDILESEIARLLAESFVREFDRVIINGTGTGQPLGIINDTRIPASNSIQFIAADMADWTKFRKNLFAKIPLAYRGQGVLVMSAGTWESNIMTLKDANDRPLYQETYDPVTGETSCRFAGREVILVEPDVLGDYDTAIEGDVWGIYFRPEDYAINSNLQIGFKRYFDDNTNKYINKGLCIMDGKALDTNGMFILKK